MANIARHSLCFSLLCMQHTHHLSVEPRIAGERGHVMSGGALKLTALTAGQGKVQDERGIVFKCLARVKVLYHLH